MLNNIKSFCIDILILVFCFIFAFIPIYSVLRCISNFIEIDSSLLVKWSVISSVVSSIVLFFPVEESLKRIGETSVSFWIGNNSHKIMIGYFILIIAAGSIENKATWAMDEISSLLSLQWTIFGFSLAIFLVWNALIVDFLKKQQPQKDDGSDLLRKYELILERRSFSQEVESMYSTVILLTANLLFLLFSTSLVYLTALPALVFTQNVVRCSFFLTTNSILVLFFDIIKPLKKEKTKMIKENKVSKQDVDNAIAAQFIHAVIKGIKESVMELDPEKYSPEEKQQILLEWREAFIEVAHAKEEVSNKDTK